MAIWQLEESRYYPFGLTMAGISDKALKSNYAENKYRFDKGSELQNKEFSDGSGLEMYETTFRGYDPQLGRFGQIDPMASAYFNWSPFQFAYDNPIGYNDPLGADIEPTPGPCVACKIPYIDPNSSTVAVRPELLGRNDLVENNVLTDIHSRSYEDAFMKLYDAYPSLNVVNPKYFSTNFHALDPNQKLIRYSGAETDPPDPNNGGRDLMTFYTNYWDQVFHGLRSYGWLVRSIYHEITHVMQYQGLFGHKELSFRESEFESNYLAVMNNNLPCYTGSETNFYVKSAISWITNDPNLIYKYRVQIQTLLNQVDDQTRKQYISDLKSLTKTEVNFY